MLGGHIIGELQDRAMKIDLCDFRAPYITYLNLPFQVFSNTKGGRAYGITR